MLPCLFLNCLADDGYRQTWTFKNRKDDIIVWLKEHDMPVDLFYQTLKNNKIQVVFDEEILPIHQGSLPDRLHTSVGQDQLIWEDAYTSIYVPAHPRVMHHLYIILKKDKQSFLDVTEEEIGHVHDTLLKVIATLNQRFGIYDYMLAFSNLPQLGHSQNHFTLEIIPSKTNRGLDLMDKVWRNNYVLMRNFAPFSEDPLSKDEIKQMTKHWTEALYNSVDLVFNEPALPVNALDFNHQSMTYELIEEFYKFLQFEGLTIEREIYTQDLDDAITDEEVKAINTKCIFCNPVAIEKESIDFQQVRAFYNIRPFIKNAHFLVTPKEHCSYFTDIPRSVFLEMCGTAKQLTTAMGYHFNRQDVKMYIQQGFNAGQTVFHTHLHVLLTPDPVRHLLFCLSYKFFPCATKKEFIDVKEWISSHLD